MVINYSYTIIYDYVHVLAIAATDHASGAGGLGRVGSLSLLSLMPARLRLLYDSELEAAAARLAAQNRILEQDGISGPWLGLFGPFLRSYSSSRATASRSWIVRSHR